jgi:hypothetical protein
LVSSTLCISKILISIIKARSTSLDIVRTSKVINGTEVASANGSIAELVSYPTMDGDMPVHVGAMVITVLVGTGGLVRVM